MATFIWVKEKELKFRTLLAVSAIVRVTALNQVNEERGARIGLTTRSIDVEESCEEIATLIDNAVRAP
jgi:hypothetical protein